MKNLLTWLKMISMNKKDQQPDTPAGVDGTPLTPVFPNETEGYACFRIPSIVRAGDGSLLAIAEGRVDNCQDHGGPIRVVCRRSVDNGHSWGPLVVIGENCRPDGDEHVAQNPSPVVDRMDPDHPQGVVFVIFNKTEFSEFDIARGKGVRRVFITRSLDHGRTWEPPVDITGQVHRPNHPAYTNIHPDTGQTYTDPHDWRQQVPATGHAIQLRGCEPGHPTAGRLFYTASVTVGDRDVYHSQNYAFWSDDHGKTWQIGGISPHEGHNEAMAVELEDGSVMINARNYRNGRRVGCRAVGVHTFDREGNIHFGAHTEDPDLIEPTIQASIHRYAFQGENGPGQPGCILFAITDHPTRRENLSVRVSYNDGRTWDYKRPIDPGPSGYCDLVVQIDGLVGLLYERASSGIFYTSFSLAWLTGQSTRA